MWLPIENGIREFKNVGELKKALSDVDDDMIVRVGFDSSGIEGLKVVIRYNERDSDRLELEIESA